ncbi:TauD/TfdA family dioxygenase [Microlunatus speluncae]|uniref:TauD/TfdA family dioxygenase n=1 Tax=Microlunatus speluncae TaxID=2594267 RepID=UPI003CCCD98A
MKGSAKTLERLLLRHGALLLRGFVPSSEQDGLSVFRRFVEAFSGPILPYRERSSPRSEIAGNVYTATDHPPSSSIFLHNELSYSEIFPSRLHFFCQRPADSGGSSLLADSREVLARVPEDLRTRLVTEGYRYVRHMRSGIGLSWQDVFQTSDRGEAESYCRDRDIELTWLPDDEAKTVQRRNVTLRHPATGELSWFNHCAFFHVSTLGAENAATLRSLFTEDALPNNTEFGGGAKISDDDCYRLRQAYLESCVDVTWQRGDLLVIDNLLVCHGRTPFIGDRRIAVAMTGSTSWDALRGL